MKRFFSHITFNLLLGCGLISLSSLSIASDTKTLIEKAEALIKTEQIEKAFELLSPIADENADDAEFNYLYGLLLQKKNQHIYAVMVLEMALMIHPNHAATQIALMKSHIALKEFKRAEKLQQPLKQAGFDIADVEPSDNHQKENKKTLYSFNGFIRSTGGYDDNLTNGPDENFMTIPIASQLGSLYVGDGLEKDQDFFYAVSGTFGLKTQFSNDLGINIGIWGSKRFNHKRPDEELAVMSTWFGGSYQYGKNNVNLDFKYQSIWINNLHYQDKYALLGQWYRPLFNTNAVALNFQLGTTRHPSSETLDSDVYNVGAIFYQQLNILWQPMMSLEVYGGEDKLHDSDNAYLGYQNIGTRFTARLHINQQNTFLISGSYENRHYKKENPFFLTTRHDHNYSMTGKYAHFFFDKQLELSAQGTWMLNRSNISLYDYQRNIATINIQWNF